MDPLAKILGEWSSQIGAGAILFRVMMAVLLAGIIGVERSTKRHAAGLRTFLITAIASCLAMIMDSTIIANGGSVYILSAATIIGIATVSVNSILFNSRNQIKGLTTSVALWACAMIGLAMGGGFYTAGIAVFAFFMLCLFVFPEFEKYLKDRSNHFEVHLELASSRNLKDFIHTARELGLLIDDVELNPAYANSGLSVYTVSLTCASKELKKYKTHKEIIEALSTLEYVSYLEEMRD